MSETIRTAPERVWLQVGDQAHYHSEPFPSDTGEVTWCADSVVGCEVPYVRADLATVVPEGWQLVPREVVAPTLSWPLDVGASAFERAKAAGCVLEDCIHDAIIAMLAAAPKPEAVK